MKALVSICSSKSPKKYYSSSVKNTFLEQ